MNAQKLGINVLASCFVLGAGVTANAADIIGIGSLDTPDASFSSIASAISRNGKVVVGASKNQGIRWTRKGGLESTGQFAPDDFTQNIDVSANGKIIAGYLRNKNGETTATRWTKKKGLESLGTLGGNYSEAKGISGNGQLIVGLSRNKPDAQDRSQMEAFIWTKWSGMHGLGYLPGGSFSVARDISSNGRVIVGDSTSSKGIEAFRWTWWRGMEGLGDLPGGAFKSNAFAASKNGNVIVGCGATEDKLDQAFRWTKKHGMKSLGELDGGDLQSCGLGVSGNGRIVVGFAMPGKYSGTKAMIWTKAGGMQLLSHYLSDRGVDLSGWVALREAKSISTNGRWITGFGINANGDQEGFVVDLKSKG